MTKDGTVYRHVWPNENSNNNWIKAVMKVAFFYLVGQCSELVLPICVNEVSN